MTTLTTMSKVVNVVGNFLYVKGLRISDECIEFLLEDYTIAVIIKSADYALEHYGLDVTNDRFARIVERVAIIG